MRRSLRASLPGTSLPGSLYAPRRTVGQTNFVTLGRGPSVGQMAARRAGKQPATGAGLLPEEGGASERRDRDTERDRGQRQSERRQDRREEGAEGSRGKKRQRAEGQRKGETQGRGAAAGGRGTRQRQTDRC